MKNTDAGRNDLNQRAARAMKGLGLALEASAFEAARQGDPARERQAQAEVKRLRGMLGKWDRAVENAT